MNKKGGKDLYHVVDGWRDGAGTSVGHGGVRIRHNVHIVVQPIIIQCFLAWNSPWRGRVSTVDLLAKIACFVKKEKYIFSV
jgi:hypothetical protein